MSEISLSVSIAAHPKRKHLVDDLLYNLEENYQAPVRAWAVWDDGDDEWGTHKRAWQSWRTRMATHHLVLQDDAIICPNLVPTMEAALAHVPNNSPVSLYFGNAQNHPKIVRAASRADEEGASWIVASGTWWGVGIILPTTLIPAMLEYCDRRREVYDRRLSIWCEHGPGGPYPVYYTWPSLVDHLDENSLVKPGRPPGRKAYRFIGADEVFDYTNGAVPCGRVMNRSTKLQGKG